MLEIIGYNKDLRTQTSVIYALTDVETYLNLVGNSFSEFLLQRRREKHKAYPRMKADILGGAVLPPITLAVKPDRIATILNFIENKQNDALVTELQNPNQVFILDGLQRTFTLKDLKEEGHLFEATQKLLLEFWVEKDIKHLIYRIIILNAGQKPMTLRHQIEILFATVGDKIRQDINGIEFNNEKDGSRRRQSKTYTFEYIVTSYYCFLTKSFEPNKENLIAQQIKEEGIIYKNEEALNQKFELFISYLNSYTLLDECLFNTYINTNTKYAHWLAKENVMNAFFASVAEYGNDNSIKQQRIKTSLDSLINDLPKGNGDILGIEIFEKIVSGNDSSKKNIGYITKKLLFEGFWEFFKNEGEKSLEECWTFVAQ